MLLSEINSRFREELSPPDGTLVFRLPRPTTLLNVNLGKHWSARRRALRDLCWEVKAATQGKRPVRPFARSRMLVVRRSVGAIPDTDNLFASLKGLSDTLVAFSQDLHPFGLDIIEDDRPSCLSVFIRAEHVGRRADQCSLVAIQGWE